MKGNIKKLAVFVMIPAIAMFMAVAMASAGNNNSKVTGEYAVTAGMSCLITPSGVNDNLTPVNPTAVGSNSITLQGIATFNRNGTGSMESTGVFIIPPPARPPGPNANAFHFSFTFTYDVADDDTITIDADENSFKVTLHTGPLTGKWFTFDTYSLSGIVSADQKTLTLGPPTTTINTLTFNTNPPPPLKIICNGSYVLTRLGGKSWERSQ